MDVVVAFLQRTGLGDVSVLQNFLMNVLNQRVFVLVNFANVDWIWFHKRIVSAVYLGVSRCLDLEIEVLVEKVQ